MIFVEGYHHRESESFSTHRRLLTSKRSLTFRFANSVALPSHPLPVQAHNSVLEKLSLLCLLPGDPQRLVQPRYERSVRFMAVGAQPMKSLDKIFHHPTKREFSQYLLLASHSDMEDQVSI